MTCPCTKLLNNPEEIKQDFTEEEFDIVKLPFVEDLITKGDLIKPPGEDTLYGLPYFSVKCSGCGQDWSVSKFLIRENVRIGRIKKSGNLPDGTTAEKYKCACWFMLDDPHGQEQTLETMEQYNAAKERIIQKLIKYGHMYVDENNVYLHHCRCGQDWGLLPPDKEKNRIGMIRKLQKG